jgi:hypothetical protein
MKFKNYLRLFEFKNKTKRKEKYSKNKLENICANKPYVTQIHTVRVNDGGQLGEICFKKRKR